jgi:hypothetical protein
VQIVAGALQLFTGVRQTCRVARCRARCGVDRGQHLRDLGGHARADAIEPIRDAAWRKIRVVNPLDVGFFERAFLRQRVVDGGVKSRAVAGGVLIPDLEIARRRRQAERADLLERDLGEGECTFVLVAWHGHSSLAIQLKIGTRFHSTTGCTECAEPKSKR